MQIADGAAAKRGCRCTCSLTASLHACAQDVVQRVGSKGPLADFARGLCARLSPQLLCAQHVAELLRMATGAGAAATGNGALDPAFLAGVLLLLADAAGAAPSLFAGFAPQVLTLAASWLCHACTNPAHSMHWSTNALQRPLHATAHLHH